MRTKIKFNKNKLLFWLTIIDILFLPYFKLVVIPFSYFLIMYWVLKNYVLIMKYKETKLILLCMLLMLLSTIFGSIINYEFGVIGDNLKRLIQYYFVFGYYYFFKTIFLNYEMDLKKVFIVFAVFVLIFALIFNSSTSTFAQITKVWNAGNSYNNVMIADSEYSGVFRYNFIWTDPNNIAYAITGIILFIFMFTSISLGTKICLIFLNIYVLISCMSSGGWFNFIISYVLYFLYSMFHKKNIKKKINLRSILIFGVVILFIVCSLDNLSNFLQSDLVANASDRFGSNENTRTEIWLKILTGENIFRRILLGKGAEIYINGISRATHSGHLYWIYAYGFVSYIIFIKIFFYLKKVKLYYYIPIISFFLCFTMNTMIGEQKLLIIFVLIVTYLKRGDVNNETGKYYCSNI